MGEWASLFFMVSLLWWKHHKGAPGCIWDSFGLVLGTGFAAVSQPAVPGVPGTEAITSKHPTGVRVPSGFNQQKTDEHIHFSCPTDFFFPFFLSHYQTQKFTHCGYYFIIFFLFLNAENTDLSNRSFSRLRPVSLEFTKSLAGDPVLLCCPSLQFWLLGTLF